MESEGNGSATEIVADLFMLQARQVSELVCWLGAYEESMLTGVYEATAVKAADNQVASLLLGEETDTLWHLSRQEPMQSLFKSLYRYANISFTKGLAGHKDEYERVQLIIDYLFKQSIPLALGQALHNSLPDYEDNIFKLAGVAKSEELDEFMGLLLLHQQVNQGMDAHEDSLQNRLSRGELLRQIEPGGSLSTWVQQIAEQKPFDQALWNVAEQEVAWMDSDKRRFRQLAIARGWWDLL
jgi:hypothetical protein